MVLTLCLSANTVITRESIEFSWGLYCLVIWYLLFYIICASAPQREPKVTSESPTSYVHLIEYKLYFLWVKHVRFLSCQDWDFRKCPSNFWRFLTIFWRGPIFAENIQRHSDDLWASPKLLNPLSPNIHIQIPQTDLYIFP